MSSSANTIHITFTRLLLLVFCFVFWVFGVCGSPGFMPTINKSLKAKSPRAKKRKKIKKPKGKKKKKNKKAKRQKKEKK
jgi:hypothetical protein